MPYRCPSLTVPCHPLCFKKPLYNLPTRSPVKSESHSVMFNSLRPCCSHAFRETNSLRRGMQIVECSLLHPAWGGPKAESPISQGPCLTFVLIYLRFTVQAYIPKFFKPSLESVKGRYNQVTAMIHNQKGQLVIHCSLHQRVP